MSSITDSIWYSENCYISAKSDLLSQGFDPSLANIGDTCIVIFCYNLFNRLLNLLPNKDCNWPYNTTHLKILSMSNRKEIAIYFPSYGATNIARSLEQLSVCGVKKIFGIGLGGTLKEDINIGDIILLEGAIKGDGVSKYYVPVEFPALPNFELTYSVKQRLDSYNERYYMGLSFGTDCLYRETEALIHQLKKLGVISIDLESSAFFTVSRRLGLECCWVGIISDRLIDSRHEGSAHSEGVIEQLIYLSKHIIEIT